MGNLLASKWNLETRKQSPCTVLRPSTFCIGDEMNMETDRLRVCIRIDLYLREETHSLGWEAEAHHACDATWSFQVGRGRGKHDTAELTQPGQNELCQGRDEIVHLGPFEGDFAAHGNAWPDPTTDRLLSLYDFDAAA